MKKKRCFFIGHRNTSESIYPDILSTIEKHIVEYKLKEFIVGNYGMFDSMVIRALQQLKEKYPDIVLLLLTPYHPGTKKIIQPEKFDGIYYPERMETVPYRAAIVKANEIVISKSDYLIAYVTHPGSNTVRFVEYAERKGVHISYIVINN